MALQWTTLYERDQVHQGTIEQEKMITFYYFSFECSEIHAIIIYLFGQT